ncbi:hypothetical protein [Frondihabitans sp. Leaf304]|uniref:hypothetical protein n=1 Tax=Frondihabitans sp. Leaf304 TaxID=1736329 RepID=UPI0006F375BD|nr:hypothetical protein [Frondihabitans sp. Leaf304]KQQ27951.1 hypothetical protein ASF54_04265 [Frondihabitans sp. Leaf304]
MAKTATRTADTTMILFGIGVPLGVLGLVLVVWTANDGGAVVESILGGSGLIAGAILISASAIVGAIGRSRQ